MSDDTLKNS